jgi:hypothetical protein
VNLAGGRTLARGFLVDLALVAVLVAGLGLAVGLLWPQLVDPALSERTAEGISTSEVQLARVFAADGWFVVLGFVGSVLLGGLLMLRRGHEVVVLLLLLLGTYLSATRIAAPLGISLGPPDPVSVLRDAEVGTTAPVRLCTVDDSAPGRPCELSSAADPLSWPLGAAIGALVVLLGATRLESREHGPDEAVPATRSDAAVAPAD